MSQITAPEVKEKHSTESIVYEVEFSGRLASGEALTGTPTVTGSPDGLTIGTPARSGTLVVCRISGGLTGTRYELTWTCGTSTNNSKVIKTILNVTDE